MPPHVLQGKLSARPCGPGAQTIWNLPEEGLCRAWRREQEVMLSEAGPVSGFRPSRSLAPCAPANESVTCNLQDAGRRWPRAQGRDVPAKRTNPSQPGGHQVCSKQAHPVETHARDSDARCRVSRPAGQGVALWAACGVGAWPRPPCWLSWGDQGAQAAGGSASPAGLRGSGQGTEKGSKSWR